MLKPYRIELLDEEGCGLWEHTIQCEGDDDAIDRTGRVAHPYRMRLSEGQRVVACFEARYRRPLLTLTGRPG
jgi:hypothetical protein